jgi:hypothetical protein
MTSPSGQCALQLVEKWQYKRLRVQIPPDDEKGGKIPNLIITKLQPNENKVGIR